MSINRLLEDLEDDDTINTDDVEIEKRKLILKEVLESNEGYEDVDINSIKQENSYNIRRNKIVSRNNRNDLSSNKKENKSVEESNVNSSDKDEIPKFLGKKRTTLI